MLFEKHLFALVSVLFIFSFISSQQLFGQKFYTEIGFQYGVPIFGDHKESSISIVYEGINAVQETEEGKFSVGQGAQFNLALGYFLSESFSIKVRGNYYTGGSSNDFKYEEFRNNLTVPRTAVLYSANSNYFGIAPMLMLHTISNSKISFNAGLGGLFALTNYQEIRDFTFGEQKQYFEVEFDADWSIGLSGEFSMNYQINNTCTIKTALNMTILDFVPKRSEVEVFELNGRSSMRLLSERDKTSIYGSRTQNYREINGDLEEVTSENEARLAPSFDVPFSNIALELGVVFRMK